MFGAVRKSPSETDRRVDIARLDAPAVFKLRIKALQRIIARRAPGAVAHQNKPVAPTGDLNAQIRLDLHQILVVRAAKRYQMSVVRELDQGFAGSAKGA